MLERTVLDEKNFTLFAARHYDNPQCFDVAEFEEDLKRFKYIKRLLNKYIEYGDLGERLILNHMISLSNVFEPQILAKMLFFKLKGYEPYFVPFLIFLSMLPKTVLGVTGDDTPIYTSEIHPDKIITEKLSKI